MLPKARLASSMSSIVIQENRSFDNFFATFPGADGTKNGKAAADVEFGAGSTVEDNGMPVIYKTDERSIDANRSDRLGLWFEREVR